jgi:NAD(P)-dependent dehydrogenase (short-subunit alcohol dehydrogenase family)
MLLNVAAVLGDGSTSPGPERTMETINRDWLRHSFDLNCAAHVMVTQGLASALKKAGKERVPKIVNISARVGSISDNGLGGWHSYR